MRIPKAAGAFDQSLAQSDLAFKPSKLEFSPWVQPKPGESDLARQLSKLQFWPWVQPKPGESDLAIQACHDSFFDQNGSARPALCPSRVLDSDAVSEFA